MQPITHPPEVRIALIGGGPSALFVFKRLAALNCPGMEVHIFESSSRLGAGMPYSSEGASREHVTNVSGNEIPELVTPLSEWISGLPESEVERFGFSAETFHDYKVVPRLLFGEYLSAQFDLLLDSADRKGLRTTVSYDSRVADIAHHEDSGAMTVTLRSGERFEFDIVVICTGHNWPRRNEDPGNGYFDSPYPPAKLAKRFNHPVAIKGSSLTAIDAVRTLARANGRFETVGDGRLSFVPNGDCGDFKIVMHSRSGLLPCIRIHLDDPQLSRESVLPREQIEKHRTENGGFVSLDYVFNEIFKESFREQDTKLFRLIRDMTIEEFVDSMMDAREHTEAFELFKAEYAEARRSIREERPIYWKENLATLSFAMNYPAKHFSAEDMLRLQKRLMPLISIVIAFAPQGSCEELIALHEAGKLEIISVGSESNVKRERSGGVSYRFVDENGNEREDRFETYIDCAGQPHLSIDSFPFRSLVDDGTLSAATLRFRDPDAARAARESGESHVEFDNRGTGYLRVPGVAISDDFEAIGVDGQKNSRLFLMAVPYIGGYNPDYSGLDFCEEASRRIVDRIARLSLRSDSRCPVA